MRIKIQKQCWLFLDEIGHNQEMGFIYSFALTDVFSGSMSKSFTHKTFFFKVEFYITPVSIHYVSL